MRPWTLEGATPLSRSGGQGAETALMTVVRIPVTALDRRLGARCKSHRAASRRDGERQPEKLALASGATACAVTPDAGWSGRPESNRRRPAWEAGILPLNYARMCLEF